MLEIMGDVFERLIASLNECYWVWDIDYSRLHIQVNQAASAVACIRAMDKVHGNIVLFVSHSFYFNLMPYEWSHFLSQANVMMEDSA
jgi:hypothetical protein